MDWMDSQYTVWSGVIKNNPNSVAKTFIGPKVQVEKLYDNPLFLKKNGKT